MEALIARLAAEAGPPAHDLRRLRGRVAAAAVGAAAVAAVMALAGLGWRGDLPGALMVPTVALKFLWAGALAVTAALALARLGQPGRRAVTLAALAPAAFAGVIGGALWAADPAPTPDFASPPFCVLAIVTMALPGLAAGFHALRAGAPVNLRAAGAAAGVLAGAGAAMGYALYCPVDSAGFVMVWYTAGVAVAAALGAAAAPRVAAW
jgi:hypothetical protein